MRDNIRYYDLFGGGVLELYDGIDLISIEKALGDTELNRLVQQNTGHMAIENRTWQGMREFFVEQMDWQGIEQGFDRAVAVNKALTLFIVEILDSSTHVNRLVVRR